VRDEEKGGKSRYAIYVNASHVETRQRSTISHEIAHYVLHDTLIWDGISDDGLYRSGLSSTVEAQENRYAADMPMPWHLANNALREGVDNVKDLADWRKSRRNAGDRICVGVSHRPFSISESLYQIDRKQVLSVGRVGCYAA